MAVLSLALQGVGIGSWLYKDVDMFIGVRNRVGFSRSAHSSQHSKKSGSKWMLLTLLLK